MREVKIVFASLAPQQPELFYILKILRNIKKERKKKFTKLGK